MYIMEVIISIISILNSRSFDFTFIVNISFLLFLILHIFISVKSGRESIFNYIFLFSMGIFNYSTPDSIPLSPSIIMLIISIISLSSAGIKKVHTGTFVIISFLVLCFLSYSYAPKILVTNDTVTGFFSSLISIIILSLVLNNTEDIYRICVLVCIAIGLIAFDYIILTFIGGDPYKDIPDLIDVSEADIRYESPMLGNNFFAIFGASILFLLTHIYLTLFKTTKYKWMILFLLIIMVVSILLTKSRSGVLLISASVIFIFIGSRIIQFKGKIKLMSTFLAGCVLFLTTNLGILISERINTASEDSSILVREEIRESAIIGIKEKIIWGWGLTTFQKYSGRDFEKNVSTHNTYLEILFSMGIIGLIGFAFITFYPILLYMRKRNFMTNTEQDFCVALISAMICILIGGWNHEVFYERFYYLFITLLMSFIFTLSDSKTLNEPLSPEGLLNRG